jgi:hypothetical protein
MSLTYWSLSKLKKRCRELEIKGFSQASQNDNLRMIGLILLKEKKFGKGEVLRPQTTKNEGEEIFVKKEIEVEEILEEILSESESDSESDSDSDT